MGADGVVVNPDDLAQIVDAGNEWFPILHVGLRPAAPYGIRIEPSLRRWAGRCWRSRFDLRLSVKRTTKDSTDALLRPPSTIRDASPSGRTLSCRLDALALVGARGRLPQSSGFPLHTAGAEFFGLSQWGERPEGTRCPLAHGEHSPHRDPSRCHFIVRGTARNKQIGGYLVAGPPSTFRFQPNDSRTVRFPAIFALRVDLVRSVRVGAQDSLLRRTHESAVKTSSPTPELLPLLILSAPPNPSSTSRLDESA